MDQELSGNDLQHKQPASPPTNANVVSVLTKMLETQMVKQQQHEKTNINPQAKNFGFYLDFPIQNQLLKCEIQITTDKKVETALRQAIDKFKEMLAEKGYDMDTDLTNYTLRLAKKNGKPKTDMPSIDLKQRFAEIKVNISSIQIKNKDCIKKKQIQPLAQQQQPRLHETISKTTSYYSIGSEIMGDQGQKKQQILSEEQALRKQKNQNCMFSFC